MRFWVKIVVNWLEGRVVLRRWVWRVRSCSRRHRGVSRSSSPRILVYHELQSPCSVIVAMVSVIGVRNNRMCAMFLIQVRGIISHHHQASGAFQYATWTLPLPRVIYGTEKRYPVPWLVSMGPMGI